MHEQLNPQRQAVPSFGTRLRGLRLRAGLSQEALAARADLGVATLKALEQGVRQRPRTHTLVRLADALGLAGADRDALLEGAEHPSPAPAAPDRPRLPIWLSSFVGRERELESVRRLLDPTASEVRLLTLLGPGGVGKTRLAVEVAADSIPVYTDGVFFVDLAPLTDARLVPATIARALDVRQGGGRSASELLVEHLRPRRVLLVLDNFEHLLGAAPVIGALVQECPHVAVLTTSRTALQLAAEQRFPIGPLALPPDDLATLDRAAETAAVRLFVERAQAVDPGFVLNPSTAAPIAAICRRLDGMPLAIELAAARIGLLPPAALLRRLERRLPLLSAGAFDLPERQQTMRSTLAWSHNLLDLRGQVLFRRVAIFAGGWTLEAAEHVCADAQLPAEDVLDALQVLLDSSLVRLDQTAAGPRFGMLETIREYAREQLVQNGELERLRAAHAEFYSELAEPVAAERTIAPWLAGRSPALTDEDIERLEAEFDNLMAALDWWLTDCRPTEGLRLAVAFHVLWSRRGQYTIGRRWLETMLDLADRTVTASSFLLGERAVALTEAGTLAGHQADNDQARDFHRRSVDAWRQLDHAQGLAIALANLGLAEWVLGRADQAVTLLEEALVRAAEANVPHTVAISLRNLGLIARSHGDYARAEALFSEAAAYPLPPGWFRGYSLARSVSCLGRVACLQHDLARGRRLLRQALEVIRQAGVTGQALGDCLDWQAALEAQAGDVVRAVRLFGAADAHWRTSAAHRYLPDEATYAQDLAEVRARLDADAFAKAWAEGVAMHPDQAIEYALQESSSTSPL